jgi:hypothetical protein
VLPGSLSPALWKTTRRNPGAKTLISDLNTAGPAVPSSFTFSSVQINVDTIAIPHADSNNGGLSTTACVDKYTKGEFVIKDVEVAHHVTDIRNKWTPINGSLTQWSQPFGGSRTSLVIFTHRALVKTRAKTRRDLADLGIRISPTAETPGPPGKSEASDASSIEDDYCSPKAPRGSGWLGKGALLLAHLGY